MGLFVSIKNLVIITFLKVRNLIILILFVKLLNRCTEIRVLVAMLTILFERDGATFFVFARFGNVVFFRHFFFTLLTSIV